MVKNVNVARYARKLANTAQGKFEVSSLPTIISFAAMYMGRSRKSARKPINFSKKIAPWQVLVWR